MFKTKPAVFAAGKNYHIMVPVNCETLMWVRVGDKCFYNEKNGVLCSKPLIHHMVVPMELLDKEKSYTICARKIIRRLAYFTETEDVEEFTFDFKPVCGEWIRAYHIADTHGQVEEPVSAAKTYGDIDLLILNGDIPNSSESVNDILVVYKIAEAITGGNIPIIFSRGNHDLRGEKAELFADCTPCDNGNSYYTVRLGDIWMLVLDCGEDKADDRIEYGHTICCHDFRLRETAFIESVIANAENEYLADGIKRKIIIAHDPFTFPKKPHFNTEEKIYRHWAELIRENIKPDMMLCGHTHQNGIFEVGGEKDALGQPCIMVVGGEPKQYEPVIPGVSTYNGVGISVSENGIEAEFTSNSGKILSSHKIL